jgi:circadian clock protein KaiC
MSDNVLLLSYVRKGAEIKRSIAVIKTRASAHDPGIREFTISGDGIAIGGAFDWMRQEPDAG